MNVSDLAAGIFDDIEERIIGVESDVVIRALVKVANSVSLTTDTSDEPDGCH